MQSVHSKRLILMIMNPIRIVPNWGPRSSVTARYPNIDDTLAAVGILR